MRLSDWLSGACLSDAVFADRIGVSRQALWRYKAGERMPRPKIVRRIEKATRGKVTSADFIEHHATREVAA